MKEKHVGFEVRMLSNLIHRKINQMITEEEESLTAHQAWVLKYLMQHLDSEIAQRDIEKQFSIRRSTASHMLLLMEKNQYIERVSVPQDARVKKIVITEKGRAASERMEERLNRFEAMLQGELSDEEIQIFLTILHKMEEQIQ